MGIILALVALFICWRLSVRVSVLQQKVDALQVSGREQEPVQSPILPEENDVTVPQTTIPHPMYPDSNEASPLYAKTAAEDNLTDQLIAWVKEDFLVKLGAGLLLLAFGWFLSYAFANNWIGPAGRIAIGLLLSSGCMILGAVRINTYAHQGGIFVSLGATGVLLTLFAARELYDMFTPASALALSFMTAVFVAFVSVRYNRASLAYAGLLLGSIAPLLVNVNAPDPLMFFLYLLLIASGTLWVVWLTGWTGLILTSLLITFGYSLTYLLDTVGNNDVAVVFSFLFVALYYGANMVSLVRRHGQGEHHMRIHAYTALGTALFLFVWIQAGIADEWQSLTYVAWSLVFALGTYVVYNFTANLPAFYLYGATSAALIGLATAAELDGLALVVAYLFEILAVIIAAGLITRSPKIPASLSWLLVLPLGLSLESLDYRRWDTVIGLDFFVLVLIVLVTSMAAVLIYTLLKQQQSKDELVVHTMATLAITAGVYASVTLWGVLHASLTDGLATIIALVVYTVAGIGLLLHGRAIQNTVVQGAGGALIGFVVLRLLLVEVWNMPIEARIVAFLVIGILLISTAFISKGIMKHHD